MLGTIALGSLLLVAAATPPRAQSYQQFNRWCYGKAPRPDAPRPTPAC